jgi:hypothetical protein
MRYKLAYKKKHRWSTELHYRNGLTTCEINILNHKAYLFNTCLKIASGATCYGLGLLAGEMMDYAGIDHAVNFLSGLNVENNLDGIVGLLGAVQGISKSGAKINKADRDVFSEITLYPIKFSFDAVPEK